MKTFKILFALAASALMASCSLNANVDFNFDNPERYSVGDATIDKPVDEINVNWFSGAITICYADREGISIWEECDTNLDEPLRMRHYVDSDGDLDIQFCKNGKYRHGQLKGLNKRLFIEVPLGMTFDEIEINTVSGMIKIDSVLSRDLTVNTVNTALEAYYPVLPDDIEVNCVNDNITLYVPATAGMTIEMDAVNADLNCTLPVRKEGKKTIIGDGRCDMEVNAVNGSVNIKEF